MLHFAYFFFDLRFQFDQSLSLLRERNKFFLNLKGSLAGNVVSIAKKEYGSFLHSL